jgi:resuscitation-promoting factor RpfB
VTNPQHQMNQPYPPAVPVAGAGGSPGKKVALILGGVLLTFVLFCCGGLAAVGALAPDPEPTSGPLAVAPAGRTGAGSVSSRTGTTAPDGAGTASPTPSASPAPSPTPSPTPSVVRQPKVETKTVTETQSIPFQEQRVNDATLASGTTKVQTNGVAGVKTLTYQVTLTDGVQTGKRLVSEQVTRQPVTKVVLVGTKVAQQCHPSYTGVCVPFADDVDCAGGSGDGPAYVRGPLRVVGPDVYGLDRDGDGIACEK